jgi:hypothetical protein
MMRPLSDAAVAEEAGFQAHRGEDERDRAGREHVLHGEHGRHGIATRAAPGGDVGRPLDERHGGAVAVTGRGERDRAEPARVDVAGDAREGKPSGQKLPERLGVEHAVDRRAAPTRYQPAQHQPAQGAHQRGGTDIEDVPRFQPAPVAPQQTDRAVERPPVRREGQRVDGPGRDAGDDGDLEPRRQLGQRAQYAHLIGGPGAAAGEDERERGVGHGAREDSGTRGAGQMANRAGRG